MSAALGPIVLTEGWYKTTTVVSVPRHVAMVPTSQLNMEKPDLLLNRPVVFAGAAASNNDEIIRGVVSKIGHPFNFVRNGVDSPWVYLYLGVIGAENNTSFTPPSTDWDKKPPAGKIKPQKIVRGPVTSAKIIETLESRGGKLTNTSALLSMLSLKPGDRAGVLKTLHSLAEAGKIRRQGDGKYYWASVTGSSPTFGSAAISDDFDTASAQLAGMSAAKSLDEHTASKDTAAAFARVWKAVDALGLTDAGLLTTTASLKASVALVSEKVAALKDIEEGKPKHIKIEVNKKVVELKDVVVPPCFNRVLQLAASRRNILLTGPAGCGKSYLSKLVADSLGLEFGGVNCVEDMSKSELVGRNVPNIKTGKDTFQTTRFLELFEKGGVFLMDEIDACDANVLLTLNTALANRYIETLGGKITAHADFVLIATANTFGQGSSKSYAGRRQLDESTLDRFRIGMVECGYDRNLEKALCPKTGFLRVFWDIRDAITKLAMRKVLSTRFIEDAYLMHSDHQWEVEDVLQGFFSPWTEAEITKLRANLTDELAKDVVKMFDASSAGNKTPSWKVS